MFEIDQTLKKLTKPISDQKINATEATEKGPKPGAKCSHPL